MVCLGLTLCLSCVGDADLQQSGGHSGALVTLGSLGKLAEMNWDKMWMLYYNP